MINWLICFGFEIGFFKILGFLDYNSLFKSIVGKCWKIEQVFVH